MVGFVTAPVDAFTFEWTTGMGTTFSPVTGAAAAITVIPAVEAGRTVVTITIAGGHVRRRWLKVTVDATQVSVDGCELDGELSGNPVTLPSGDGTPGGNAVFHLGNQPGDVNGDRVTLLTDVGLIRAAVNPLPVPITNIYDVDKSGQVVLTDLGLARAAVSPLPLPLISP